VKYVGSISTTNPLDYYPSIKGKKKGTALYLYAPDYLYSLSLGSALYKPTKPRAEDG